MTVGTYTYMDGSQFGMLALHQLMRQMPLLLDSRIQVSNRIKLNVKYSMCSVRLFVISLWTITTTSI